MDLARRAFDWIASVAVAADGGLGWPEDGVLSDDLYSGTAGVLLGCAEAEAAGLGTAHVSAGARGRLLSLARQGPGRGHDARRRRVLWLGWSRGGAARLVGRDRGPRRRGRRRAGDPADRRARHAGAARPAALHRRDLRRRRPPAGPAPDDAGPSVQAAHVLADRLADAAEPFPEGLHWRMTAGRESIMPGFSHGTAGAAYALAAASHTLHRRDLVNVAIRGAEAILAAGDRTGGLRARGRGAVLLPHSSTRAWLAAPKPRRPAACCTSRPAPGCCPCRRPSAQPRCPTTRVLRRGAAGAAPGRDDRHPAAANCRPSDARRSPARQAGAWPGQHTDIIAGDAGLLLVLIADDSTRLSRPRRSWPLPTWSAGSAGSTYQATTKSIMPGFSHAPPGRLRPAAADARAPPRPGGCRHPGAEAILAAWDHPAAGAPLQIPPRPGPP